MPTSSRFQAWARTLDARWLAMSYWPAAWIAITVGCALLLVLLRVVPQAREVFGLRPVPPLLLLAMSLVFALAVFELDRVLGLSLRVRGLSYCAVAFVHEFAAASFVAFSEEPGSFVLATGPIVTAWWHAAMFRASFRAPFVQLAGAGALLAAFALRPEPWAGAVLGVVAALGLGGGAAIGSFLTRVSLDLAHLDAQREAIAAQTLAAASIERERASASLETALSREREALEGLGVALRLTDRLSESVEGCDDVAVRAELSGELAPLRSAIVRLAHSIEPVGANVPSSPEPGIPTPVWPELRDALADAEARWPEIRFELRVRAGLEGTRALVAGGREALRQVVDNLIGNACEGDGVQRPGQVEVELADAGGPWLAIRVCDDGPGFPPAVLGGPIEPFASSKLEGTGLGLYLIERVVRSSGGSLERRNADAGGAQVVATLPLAADDGASSAERSRSAS